MTKCLALIPALLCTIPIAQAQRLDFTGLDGDRRELIDDYYAGGDGGWGSRGGPNYGITFSNGSYACSGQPGGYCDTAAIPGGGNALGFSGTNTLINLANGFSHGLSFWYSSPDFAHVAIYAGPNATGRLLAVSWLGHTPTDSDEPACQGTALCPYVFERFLFSSTAYSVQFNGNPDQMLIAALTFNSLSVPESQAWMLLITGTAVMGAAIRSGRAARRRPATA